MERTIIFICLLLLVSRISAQCVYNETMCTCLFGSTTSGACYQQTGTDSSGVALCSKRNCDAGWTCDCNGDYYCSQQDLSVFTLLDFNDADLTTDVQCQEVTQRTVTSAGFQLGYFHPQFSDTGLLDGQCQIFAWWLNGVLMNNFASSSTVTVTSDNLATVKTSLSDWNSLPLISGSVIGFRWRGAPYSCYNSFSELNVNGTTLDSTSSSVTHRFSNVFESDWFANDFVEGSNWGESIASSTGDNYGQENTALTNTYWRIKIL